MSDVPNPDRHARRRERTRRKLLDAGAALFARQGVDNTRINEITEHADVGFGSFYNHFESKEAIVAAVLAEAISGQDAAIETATRRLEDPAEVVSTAHRFVVRRAVSDPEWAWLLLRLDLSQVLTHASFGPFAEHDLERGIESGRFQVPDKQVALYASGGALLAVMRAVLDGRAPKAADRHHAEGVLRMLGLSPEDAAEVARRPMPRARAAGV